MELLQGALGRAVSSGFMLDEPQDLRRKVVRAVTAEELEYTIAVAARYRELARMYADGEVAWPYGP